MKKIWSSEGQNTRATSLQLILIEGSVNYTQVCYLTGCLFLFQVRTNPESQGCPYSDQVQQNCSCPQLLKQQCSNKDEICCSLLQKQVLIHFPEAAFPSSIHSFNKQLKIAAAQREQTHTPPVCYSQKPAMPMKLSLPTHSLPSRREAFPFCQECGWASRPTLAHAPPAWGTKGAGDAQSAGTSKPNSREMAPRNLLCFQEKGACSKQLSCFSPFHHWQLNTDF